MPKTITWTLWLLALAVNGFAVFLWGVFGLAGAGSTSSPQGQGLLCGMVLGVGLPLLSSMYLMTKDRFVAATLTTLALLPLSIGLSFALVPVFQHAVAGPAPLAAAHASPASSASIRQEAEAKVAKEMAQLKAHFVNTPCMKQLLEQPSKAMPADSFSKEAYTVELPGPTETDLRDHPDVQVLMVRKTDHMAYLIVSGGFDGSSRPFGPMNISHCLSH